QPAGTACTEDGNPCTLDECAGASAACMHPAGHAGTVCRASAGDCDPAESCDGSQTACPADQRSTAVCRPASGPCDAAESCDGSSVSCPADAFLPDGSACTDGDACTHTDACQGGSCVGSDPVSCAAPDQCHEAGVCDTQTGVCSYQNKPDG